MITEKDTIKCEAVFSEDKKHRFLWKRVWDKDRPMACVIMLNPCHADTLTMDVTTSLVANNIVRLGGYGGVSIVNLFSLLTNKLIFRFADTLNDEANDTYIQKAAEEASVVILAWGKAADVNLKIYQRSQQVIKLLKGQKEKLRVISDGKRSGCHPLTPALRSQWYLTGTEEWQKASEAIAKQREERAKEKLAASKADSTKPKSTETVTIG